MDTVVDELFILKTVDVFFFDKPSTIGWLFFALP